MSESTSESVTETGVVTKNPAASVEAVTTSDRLEVTNEAPAQIVVNSTLEASTAQDGVTPIAAQNSLMHQSTDVVTEQRIQSEPTTIVTETTTVQPPETSAEAMVDSRPNGVTEHQSNSNATTVTNAPDQPISETATPVKKRPIWMHAD